MNNNNRMAVQRRLRYAGTKYTAKFCLRVSKIIAKTCNGKEKELHNAFHSIVKGYEV